MNKIICRFAPSPTGYLHIGNIRTAIINYLFAKKNGGQFMLRLDDTDESRVKDEYREMILKDMSWLGLDCDGEIIKQSDRLDVYERAKNKLIESGRIYQCFETPAELEFQRKAQISNGQRPLYDRSALNLTKEQKEKYIKEGRKPYWRFLLKDQVTKWHDAIRGEIKFEGLHFSDPVLIRENNVPTYTFCSVVDDIDFEVSDVIRGEDHITNTAIQIQIFQALGVKEMPQFAHLGLVKASSGKISKREGGFDIKTLREDGFEALAIINLLSQIGVSKALQVESDIEDLINKFDLNNFSKSATNYNFDELSNINQKLLHILPFSQVKEAIDKIIGSNAIDEIFWDKIKANISFLFEVKDWYNICKKELRYQPKSQDKELLKIAKDSLPDQIDANSWQQWVVILKEKTGLKGRNLFMPLRLALTGQEDGPQLKDVLILLDRSEILSRLSYGI